MRHLLLIYELVKNMGLRYVLFRLWYEARRKLGWLKRQYPVSPAAQRFIGLEDWRAGAAPFFFESRESLSIPRELGEGLREAYAAFRAGRLAYFSAQQYELGRGYDWLTNPANGYRYDAAKHWTEIPDFSAPAGDIKMVWEKSRFSYLYTLIRYDYHGEEDCADLVFSEIDSWIAANPINQGPNWRCSQEISLRTLNWVFALYYYRYSPALTEERFQRMMQVVYWQLRHVAQNINFSRIAVRNNHALTETLMLYLGGLLFPFFPEAAVWKRRGKAWFEEEVAYQLYDDGTFLLFSHNYHRVAVQLLCWALYLSERQGERWARVVYERAERSLQYLYACAAGQHGALPNYGANDGAWFFPLSSTDYRDYRPQLDALYFFFNRQHLYPDAAVQEEAGWYGAALSAAPGLGGGGVALPQSPLQAFPQGGCYLIREADTLSFIKCARYKDRPSHADNLHLDLWYRGENIMRDAGTYLYNTDAALVRYFNGTGAHNTVSLGPYDQMEKGPRFIWLHWSQAELAELYEAGEAYVFAGRIRAFRHLARGIRHERQVRKLKGQPHWSVSDRVAHRTGLPLRQYWHPGPAFWGQFAIEAVDEHGQPLVPSEEAGFYSGRYGEKEPTRVLVFETFTAAIHTKIYRV